MYVFYICPTLYIYYICNNHVDNNHHMFHICVNVLLRTSSCFTALLNRRLGYRFLHKQLSRLLSVYILTRLVFYHFCIVLILQNLLESKQQEDHFHFHYQNVNLQGQPYALSSFFRAMRTNYQ
jgi:hypothetical protein